MSATEQNLILNNSNLNIEQVDPAGQRFDITGFDTAKNPANEDAQGFSSRFSRSTLIFNDATVEGDLPSGITEDALLAVLQARLELRAATHNCESNAEALLHLKLARGLITHRDLRANAG